MPIIAKEGGTKKSYPPCSEGLHGGVCVGVYDVGTQVKEWQGETKTTRQVVLIWELPKELLDIEFKNEDGTVEKKNLPRHMCRVYTLSLHERALLRKLSLIHI